jgi:hypothetical protein
LEANSKETGHGSSSSKLGAGSSASEGVTSHHVSWLRQLWLLLQGRCYSPWMLWFAAALNRAGETQLACEAAAQGLLPGCCSYWGIKAVKTVYAACFKALLPQLVRLGRLLLGWGSTHGRLRWLHACAIDLLPCATSRLISCCWQ